MTKHGAEGYVVFFGTLEIYSREFKPENGWKLVVSWAYFHQKLRVSQSKLKKILSEITKWTVVDNGHTVSVFIPKFTELLDEWTNRKIVKTRELLGSDSGVTPKILKRNTDKDTDKDNTLVLGRTLTPCPHQKIIEEYNRILGPFLPQVKPHLWKGKRASWLQTRWKERESRQNVEWWTGLFERVKSIPFMLGKNDREWKADLEWIVKESNFVKILEGKYEKQNGRNINTINGTGQPGILVGAAPVASEGKEPDPRQNPPP